MTEELCRGCMTDKADCLLPLYNGDLAEIFQIFTTINISPDDGLPTYICNTCANRLYEFKNFKEQCLTTDMELKHIFEADLFDEETLNQVAELNVLVQPDQIVVKRQVVEAVNNVEITDNEREQQSERSNRNLTRTRFKTRERDPTHLLIKRKMTNEQTTTKDSLDPKPLNQCESNSIANITNKKKYQCDTCSMRFHYKSTLETHLQFHSIIFTCESCKLSFTTRTKFKRHFLGHVNANEFQCNFCLQKFRLKISLEKHLQLPLLKCDICWQRIDHRQFLPHLRSHRDRRKYVCLFCGKIFAINERLQCHLKNCERNRRCLVCCVCFAPQQTFAEHVKTHIQFKRKI